jgi:tetratricopeptide (TPR) repeat protein
MTTTTRGHSASSAALRLALDDLRRMDAVPKVRLALAEGAFRLAIAGDTPVDEGIALLRSAVAQDPFLVKGYLHLGRVLHQRGRYRAAALEYLAGLELAPASRRLPLLLAESLLELGKEAEQAGEDLIRAVAERSPEQLHGVLAAVRDLLADDPGDDTGEAPDADRKTDARKRAPRRRPAAPPADLGDVWLAWLLVQLRRRAKPAQVASALRAGAARVDQSRRTELAVGCLLVLLAGYPADLVRSTLETLDLDPDEPAVRALSAVLELAEAPAPSAFLHAAAVHLAGGALPADAVCALHYDRFGAAGYSLAESLRMIDAYPPAVQLDGVLQELRLAALDHFAAQAWDAGALAQARLLWREALAVDPYRIPIAVNLALLAARMNAAEEEYESAWERLFELLYLLAAGVGDVQMMLAERRDLHLALARQSWQRHCGSTPLARLPSQAEVDAWVADADALGVWLREWDGYYVNARLAFRSPVHVLGVALDAPTSALVEARDTLIEGVGAVATGRGWAGGAVFRELAVSAVEDAYARTTDPVDRARDPYYEVEKARADELADDVVQRALVLLHLVGALARAPVGAAPAALAAAVVRHQRRLPREILRSLFVDRGLVEDGVDPRELFEDAVHRLADSWVRARHTEKPEPEAVAAALDTLVEVADESVLLRYLHASALRDAHRKKDAYATAVSGLLLASPTHEETSDLRGALVGLLDQIGEEEIPGELRGTVPLTTAENAIGRLTVSLRAYPASALLRHFVAYLHMRLSKVSGLGGQQGVAAELVVTGVVDALDERQSKRLTPALDDLVPAYAAGAVRAAARELAARPAAAAANSSAEWNYAGRVARCLELARRYALDAEVAALEEALTRHQSAATSRIPE